MRKKIHPVLTGMKGYFLNSRQARFVQEYCLSWNATDAARKAGYSPKSANRYGIELLNKKHVRDEIQFKQKELATQSNITCLRTLQEYVSVGFSDLGNIVEQEADGGIVIKDLEAMAPHIRASVASVSCEKTQTKFGMATKTKITLHPKLDALNNIVRLDPGGVGHAKFRHPGVEARDFASSRTDLQPEGVETALLRYALATSVFHLGNQFILLAAEAFALAQQTRALGHPPLLGFAEDLHPLAGAIEILFVVRQGECGRVVSIAQVVELVTRSLQGGLGLGVPPGQSRESVTQPVPSR